jgi:hypothetical protein
VTLSWKTGGAALVRRGPSIVRRLRLASGLVLFSHVFLHFLNHSLGNISFEAMERGAEFAELIWRSSVGTVALYGAFASTFRSRSGRSTSAAICEWAGSRGCASASGS